MNNMKYNKIQVEDRHVFYSASGSPEKPAILLLHGFPNNNCRMKGFMKHVKNIPIYLCIPLVLLLFMSSCNASKEIFNSVIVDSITDPKTGTPIFTREYDTQPYQINVVEIVKSRKAQKKKKKMENIEKYDTHQDRAKNEGNN